MRNMEYHSIQKQEHLYKSSLELCQHYEGNTANSIGLSLKHLYKHTTEDVVKQCFPLITSKISVFISACIQKHSVQCLLFIQDVLPLTLGLAATDSVPCQSVIKHPVWSVCRTNDLHTCTFIPPQCQGRQHNSIKLY